jgi:hypothetical protein
VASPYGWHDVNGLCAEYIQEEITYGQRLILAERILSGSSPDGGASLLFDFPYGGVNVDASSYIDANTNLFYMNNVMHDIWYRYGFDETSRNFQQNNYGKGGKRILFILMPKMGLKLRLKA